MRAKAVLASAAPCKSGYSIDSQISLGCLKKIAENINGRSVFCPVNTWPPGPGSCVVGEVVWHQLVIEPSGIARIEVELEIQDDAASFVEGTHFPCLAFRVVRSKTQTTGRPNDGFRLMTYEEVDNVGVFLSDRSIDPLATRLEKKA